MVMCGWIGGIENTDDVVGKPPTRLNSFLILSSNFEEENTQSLHATASILTEEAR